MEKITNRSIENKEYRFEEAKHLHQLLVDGEWKNLTGCTTVLSILNKPALIQWSANEAIKYVQENSEWTKDGLGESIFRVAGSTLEQAKTAHRKKKEKAGDWGTGVHAEIERIVAHSINVTGGIISEDFAKAEMEKNNLSVNHFLKWAKDNKVRFLETEKCMYSKKLFIGGICDLLVEIDNQLWIADIKTGSGIYYEAFWQMAGYGLMMEEMGYPQLTGAIVLNLKKDFSFEEKRSVSNEDARKGFLACLEIYRLSEKLKNNI